MHRLEPMQRLELHESSDRATGPANARAQVPARLGKDCVRTAGSRVQLAAGQPNLGDDEQGASHPTRVPELHALIILMYSAP